MTDSRDELAADARRAAVDAALNGDVADARTFTAIAQATQAQNDRDTETTKD